jgi:hypothetical protein
MAMSYLTIFSNSFFQTISFMNSGYQVSKFLCYEEGEVLFYFLSNWGGAQWEKSKNFVPSPKKYVFRHFGQF